MGLTKVVRLAASNQGGTASSNARPCGYDLGWAFFGLKAMTVTEQEPATKWVYIDPLAIALVSLAAGLLFGALMVCLDPWLRFSDVPVHINWREAALVALFVGGYGMALSWLLTRFWRDTMLWAAAILLSPLVTGAVAAWNAGSGAFGFKTNLLVLFPFVASIHLLLVAFALVYMNMILHYPARRVLAFTVVPLVLLMITFPGVGRLRWQNPEAHQIMVAVDGYASQTVDGAYHLEYLGTRYRGSGAAPTGTVRIHADAESQLCRVRLFPGNTNVSCVEE